MSTTGKCRYAIDNIILGQLLFFESPCIEIHMVHTQILEKENLNGEKRAIVKEFA